MLIWERRAREVNGQMGAQGAQQGRMCPTPLRGHTRPGALGFFEVPGIFLNVRSNKNYRVCLAFTFF